MEEKQKKPQKFIAQDPQIQTAAENVAEKEIKRTTEMTPGSKTLSPEAKKNKRKILFGAPQFRTYLCRNFRKNRCFAGNDNTIHDNE